MKDCINKLALFQFNCSIKLFEEIFNGNAQHMWEKYTANNNNLLNFFNALDENNFDLLMDYIENNIHPINS